ncbi:hypothetical protein [Stackebrandtia albiflava]|uniref:hypothetical protein n=1 Tax=Stackebrandtia albiflava TaxID=406432 RepID=UPI001FCE4C00|nr:hypothetical protein [Stackebrandtia albiflava]
MAAALPDCGWLRDVPDDRAVIVVADGLFGFLDPDTVATVLREITGHFPHGELVFNAYTPLVARMIANTTTRSVGLPKGYRGFGIADPRELTARCPGLRFVEEQTGVTAPETARLPWFTRFVARLFAHWPAQARRGVWVLRYAFGAEPGRV